MTWIMRLSECKCLWHAQFATRSPIESWNIRYVDADKDLLLSLVLIIEPLSTHQKLQTLLRDHF